MDKKNYNLEVYFESIKKSFVILSKNKITFDELKQRTIREFRIPKEFEKDMRFTIKIRNIPITLTNDVQILKNFEEMSKNNYYLKINFNMNNNNYIYHSSKIPLKKTSNIYRTHLVSYFSIISNVKKENNLEEDKENKYIEEIKKLKEEIEKLKIEKNNNKTEIDIRKFDEKYRDLSNKNNILEQKIVELEKENKTLKLGANKNTISDNLLSENNFENDSLIKEIEKIFSKLIDEHDHNMIKEITGIKNSIDFIKNEQKNFYRFKKIDNNFELLKEDTNINLNNQNENIINTNEDKNSEDKINDDNSNKNNINNSNEIDDDNYEDIENILKDQNKDKKNDIQNSDKKNKDNLNEYNSNKSKIKRNINFFDEDEKNSKSFNNSKNNIKIKKKSQNLIKEIKNIFLENNNMNEYNKIKKNPKDKDTSKNYSKYTAPKKQIMKKMKGKINQKHIFNNSNSNKEKTEETLNNYESSSEINSETKKTKSGNMVNTSNSQKNFLIKVENKRKNEISKFTLNEKNMTPTGINESERGEKNSFKQISITPTGKDNSIKENIENYFINIFQNIFFYGNNGYLNLLKISDKLLKKLREGIGKYRMNIKEIRDYCIKYISFSIIPIVNDYNTKEYQRKIIKEKITTILETLRIDKKYFEKDYKELSEDKKDKNYDDKNINGINITHNKINEFRKFYELKEKEYPDELIIKALIKFRGNRELAFQYLFY